MIRKRLQRRELPGTARFLTFSCYQRYALFHHDSIKTEFVRRLEALSIELSVEMLAWVIMPNHVHLVVYSDSTTVDAFLKRLKGPFSQYVLRRWKRLNAPVLDRLRTVDGLSFWQAGGGYDRNVVGKELLEKIRYCHLNPVKRGLTDCSVDWPWSSARRHEGREDAIGPMISFDLIPRGSGSLI